MSSVCSGIWWSHISRTSASGAAASRSATRNLALAQSLDVHRRLTGASAQGVGIAGIAEILADLLDVPLTVESTVAGVDSVVIGDARSSDATTYPIRAGEEVVGSLTVYGPGNPSSYRLQAIEHGTTVLALESVKLRSQWEIEDRVSADLLGDILDHEITPGIRRRAARLGVDVTEDCRVVVFGARGRSSTDIAGVASSIVRRHGIGGLLLTSRAGTLVVAVPGGRDDTVDRVVRVVHAGLRDEGFEPVVGIGPRANLMFLQPRVSSSHCAVATAHSGWTSTPWCTTNSVRCAFCSMRPTWRRRSGWCWRSYVR
ncbi:hypothetical protein JWS13_31490 [Rhodococcus pseudokoreensis]|uniref:CdaR GGDEF-like domain-containing protein n=1 Tax=Rhodococcus pseudokoreensis TaxID=2811421 RepID=A0A974ZWB9_9NOCA|nr:hypothetical protein [Rhodococcus pseudokoreensis]QSE92800.1 hypothetical protein JWS13_31490 [Rhodococcus pseudokoreensis]